MEKLYVTIGVTGHRIINRKYEESIKEILRREIKSLKNNCPNCDFVMLNSLAEGSDLICAEIAKEFGIKLIAVLPMPIEEYEKDFSAEGKKLFNDMLSNAWKTVYTKSETGIRDDMYRSAGLYVADHSHILFALWDGKDGSENGCGAADMVFHLKHDRISSSILHIKTPRESEDFEPSSVLIESEPGLLKKILADTNEFNGDASDESIYDCADRLSVINQRDYLSSLRALAIMGVLMVLSFLLYDEVDIFFCLPLYAVLLIFGGIILRNGRKKRFHEKYVNYRLLAETLRVQSVLDAMNIDENAASYFTWTQSLDTAWIKYGIDALKLCGYKKANTRDGIEWIDSQLEYHVFAILQTGKKNKRNELYSKLLNILTIVAIAAALFIEIFAKPLMAAEVIGISLKTVFLIAIGVLSAGSLFLSSYYGKLALGRKNIDHESMIRLYKIAKQFITEKGFNPEIVKTVAREEIIENGNWYSYVKENKLDINI